MSKLVESMEKAGDQAPTPMGFGSPSRDLKPAQSMVVVGRVTPGALDDGLDPATSTADAILLDLEEWDKEKLKAASGKLGERLWGVRLSGPTTEQTKYLVSRECDFVIFEAERTAAGIFAEDKLGKIISTTSTMDEDYARALAMLSIDAGYFAPEPAVFPLSVQDLIELGKVRGLLDTPFLMKVPGDLNAEDLTALRDLGVAGLVLELSASKEIARTQEAIAGLPKRRPKSTRGDALVPSRGFEAGVDAPLPPAEDDDDEDEDFRVRGPYRP